MPKTILIIGTTPYPLLEEHIRKFQQKAHIEDFEVVIIKPEK